MNIASQQQADAPSLPSRESLEQSAREAAGLTPGSQADTVYSDLLPTVQKSFENGGQIWEAGIYMPNVGTPDFEPEDKKSRQASMRDCRFDEQPSRNSDDDGLGVPFTIMCTTLGQHLKDALPEEADCTRRSLEVNSKYDWERTPTTHTFNVRPKITFYTTQSGSEGALPTCRKHTIASAVSVVGLWPEKGKHMGDGGRKGSAGWEWFKLEQPKTTTTDDGGSCQ